MYIYESEMREFIFNKLISSGIAVNEDDIDTVAELIFEYLIFIGILNEDELYYDDEVLDDEE